MRFAILFALAASPAACFLISSSTRALGTGRFGSLVHSSIQIPIRAASRNTARPGAYSIRASIDRRAFLAAAGTLFSQIDVDRDGFVTDEELREFFDKVSIPSLPAADVPKKKGTSSAPKKETVDKIANGLLRLSNQNSFDEKSIALFSDGSAAFEAAVEAVKQVGGTPVIIDPKSDLDEIR